MDSEKIEEIQTVVQKDVIQSTYKLALLRAIIEIAQESARNKVLSNGRSAYPFPLLQRKILTYYYPLFAHASFIPQMVGEAEEPGAGRQLVLRTRMDPIIQYYQDRGGCEAFLSDIRQDRIPGDIAPEYARLLEAIRKTLIMQPMQFLGNAIDARPYSIVSYLKSVPESDTNAPRPPSGYFAIPHEYVSIFEDRACAQELLDAVIGRWVAYTRNLSDSLTSDELNELLVPGTGGLTVEPIQGSHMAVSLLASILPGYEQNATSREKATSLAAILEKAIEDDYAHLSTIQENITDADTAVIRTELQVQRIREAMQRIAALHGVYPEDGEPQGTSKALSRYSAEQQAAHAAHADMTDRIIRKKHAIAEIKRERERLMQDVQEAEKAIEDRELQEEEICRLRQEIALLEGGSRIQPKPFGYVDKPVARFLTYCGDVAEDILSECIRLIPGPAETAMTKPALPTWFLEEFDTWWRARQEVQRGSREGGAARSVSRGPYLIFDERRSEIRLVLPPQPIDYKDGLDHASLIVRDASGILYEEELPLYYGEKELGTEENIVRLERPAQRYHVEFSVDGTTTPWQIEGFGGRDALRFFDSDTGRNLDNQRLPLKSFILLARKMPVITPETAVLSTGRLFGNWYEFQYCVVEPVAGLSIQDAAPISDGSGSGSTKLDLRIDPEHFDRNLRIDGRNVVLGPPPPLQISFADEDTFRETILSLHPLDRDGSAQPIFRRLEDLREGAEIGRDGRICTVDLGHSDLLGSDRVGSFAIRVRNETCRTDIRVECVFLPGISYRFSQPLYLPAEDETQVHLAITCPPSVQVEPEGSVTVESTGTGYTLTSGLVPRIRGTLRYRTPEGSLFEGILAISVPHAAWRFEDERKRKIFPIQRSVPTIPDTDYLSLGSDLNLQLFLPEHFSGVGAVSVLNHEQIVKQPITNGQGNFSLTRFSDTIRTTGAKIIDFTFALENPGGGDLRFPLFTLQRWCIDLAEPPRVSRHAAGERVIEIAWEEPETAQTRFILLWREGTGLSGPSRIYVEELAGTARTHMIREDREHLRLPPGRYYLQFYRMQSAWSPIPASFPGAKAPNVFPFFIAQDEKTRAKTDEPEQEVDRGAGIDPLIAEIETGDAERCSRAIADLKRDYPVRLLPDLWPERYTRLQEALTGMIVSTALPSAVRSTGAQILGKNLSEKTESALVQVLSDPASTEQLRSAVVRALGHGKTEECLNALLNALTDPDPAIRGEAAASLGRLNNPRAIEPLIRALDDESLAVQRTAAAALGDIASLTVLEALTSVAFDASRDTDLRITAIAALGKFRVKEETVQRLFSLSEDEGENAKIREIAISVLSRLGILEQEVRRKHISELIQRARAASSPAKRISAIKQLSTFTDEEVVSALMETALDNSAEIRKASAESLGRIASHIPIPALVRLIPALMPLLDDPDADVQDASEFVCRRIRDDLLSEISKTVERRQRAARHLAEMGSFAVGSLLNVLRDAETMQSDYAKPAKIRKTAVQALAAMKDPCAVEILIQALWQANDWIVWGAAQALGAIGDTDAIKPLVETATWYKHASHHDSRVTFVYLETQKALDKLTGSTSSDQE